MVTTLMGFVLTAVVVVDDDYDDEPLSHVLGFF